MIGKSKRSGLDNILIIRKNVMVFSRPLVACIGPAMPTNDCFDKHPSAGPQPAMTPPFIPRRNLLGLNELRIAHVAMPRRGIDDAETLQQLRDGLVRDFDRC